MKKIFIDGKEGTTGLRIYERLGSRTDIELLTLPEEYRKDLSARKEMLNAADAAFLCLPDAAAIESVSLVENDHTVLLDTSTAHRTAEGWVYGFPELSDDIKNAIPAARRIAVPGCHASGFIALIRPLADAGVLSPDAHLSCQSVSGYSGGGKKAIAQYEDPDRSPLLSAPRVYALGQTHKHLKEMRAMAGIAEFPVFTPYICPFYSGMLVTVPLFMKDLAPGTTKERIAEIYAQKYCGPVVKFADASDDAGMVSALALSGKDGMQVMVWGNEDRIQLTAVYDNLGKGASGAAIQLLNMVLGAHETTGLCL